jgi:adenylate cyclase
VAASYKFDDFEFAPATRLLLRNGAPQELGARAFDLLACLFECRDRVVSKGELMDKVWPGLVVSDNNLTVQVFALRKLLGTHAIKNVARRGYQFALSAHSLAEQPRPPLTPAVPIAKRLEAAPERLATPATADGLEADLSFPGKPSIAVLPFLNLSGDAQQDYFADGICEDITTELSRFQALFVIARNSAFSYKGRAVDVRTVSRELSVRYVVEGSVRRAGNRVRVTVQLIDAVSGNHLWAEKYDRVMEDLFDLQEEVTQSIVGAVAPQIHAAEQTKARRVRPGNLGAHDLAMRANANSLDALRRNDHSLWTQALAEARQALAMDAHNVLALTVVAELMARFVGTPQFDEDMLGAYWKEGVAAAGQAIDLDPAASPAYRWMGLLLAFGGFYDEGRAMASRGLELNPNDALAYSNLAYVEVWAEQPEAALALQVQATRLSPRDASRYAFTCCRSLAYFQLKDYARALEFAKLAVSEAPHSPAPHVALTIAAVCAGAFDMAAASFEFLQTHSPGYVRLVSSGNTTFGKADSRRRAVLALRIAAGQEPRSAAAELL